MYGDTLWDLTLVTCGNYFDTKMCFVTCSVPGYDDHVTFSFGVGREGFVTDLASRLGGFLFGSIFAGKQEKS